MFFQEQAMFHNSVFYNLSYGDVTKSPDDVYKAAKLAEIHHQIMKMPKGYDTQVGERGVKLSGKKRHILFIIFVDNFFPDIAQNCGSICIESCGE